MRHFSEVITVLALITFFIKLGGNFNTFSGILRQCNAGYYFDIGRKYCKKINELNMLFAVFTILRKLQVYTDEKETIGLQL